MSPKRLMFVVAVSAFVRLVEPAFAYTAYLTVSPETPTPRSPVTVNVELTNDSLNPCDFEVRLAMAYAGLTFFDRESDGNTITYRAGLWPHLVVPMVPCDVVCIALAQAPHEVYATLELGTLKPGDYEVRVFLPGVCDLPTPCDGIPIVKCQYESPLTTKFHVQGPTPVRRKSLLTTAWARLKTTR